MLDLSAVKTSYMEENPRFKDTFFTKFSLPFEFYLDSHLRLQMGHYDNINSIGLAKKYEGYHTFEGHVKKGVLEILEVEGNLVRAQLDSGFEELPNFDKKLSELPLEHKAVDDIYTHAEQIIRKKYPETNYNFPQVIYNEKQKEKGFEIFDGFINRRRKVEGNYVFLNNQEYQNNEALQGNRNIIQPMPYLLHILKVGFADAGFQLKGEILKDSDFLQRVVYSGLDYHIFTKKMEQQLIIGSAEYYEISNVTYEYRNEMYTKPFGKFRKEITVTTLGKWLLLGDIVPKEPYEYWRGRILFNGQELWSIQQVVTSGRRPVYRIALDFSVVNTDVDNKLVFEFQTVIDDANIVTLNLRMKTKHDADGNPIPAILNPNEVNLKRAVPDMTFGDLVRTVKNWKNYDMYIVGNDVFMDVLTKKNTHIDFDISAFEVANPIKTFVNKRSYNIVFPDLKEAIDTIYIDEKGVKIGGKPSEDTNEIRIDGYCLPVQNFRGTITAIPQSDNAGLMLIYYDGLVGEQNLAQQVPGLMPPEIISKWEEWFQMRIDSNEIRWSFFANKNKWRHIDIRSTLYAYGQKLWIKEMTKEVLNAQMYKIDINAEIIR